MTYFVKEGSSLSNYNWVELSEDEFELVPVITDKGALHFHRYGNPIPKHGFSVGGWLMFTDVRPDDLSFD